MNVTTKRSVIFSWVLAFVGYSTLWTIDHHTLSRGFDIIVTHGDIYANYSDSVRSYGYKNITRETSLGLVTGRLSDNGDKTNRENITIAIGGAMTSHAVNITNTTSENISHKFIIFKGLFPSFCKTASSGYLYAFYFGYDDNDKFFKNVRYRELFLDTFMSVQSEECSPRGIEVDIYLIQCKHRKKPAWAQNDAMMVAYDNGADYFYRINDDTSLTSPDWTGAYIRTLKHYTPPNIGLVGPHDNGGVYTVFLTHEFTHRSHIEVFGFYYPRIFTGWFGDEWMTTVYKPYRCSTLKQVQVEHTMSMGTRYNYTDNSVIRQQLAAQVKHDKDILQKYLRKRRT